MNRNRITLTLATMLLAAAGDAAAGPPTPEPLYRVIPRGQMLTGSTQSDRLGWSLFLFDEGDTALVAARYWNARRGRVYEYTWRDGEWVITDQFTPADAIPGDDFGDSIIVDGEQAIVGAIQDDMSPPGPGKAYIYDRVPGGGWTESATLAPDDGVSGDYFGFACGLVGDDALVGASKFSQPSAGPGVVYAFHRTDGRWTQTQAFTASDPEPGDVFGSTLVMAGTTAVIGAGHQAEHRGAAYVFERGSDDAGVASWTEVQKIVPDDVGAGDYFGLGLALDGDRLIIGAATADIDGVDGAGAAYVYERQDGVWTEVQKITAMDGPDAGAGFGLKVSLDGDRLVLGSDGTAGFRGAAYLYHHDGDAFVGQQKFLAPNGGPFQFFGRDVKVLGNRIAVGAMLHPLAGAGYAFDVGLPCPADIQIDAVVNVIDLFRVIGNWGPCPPSCAWDINGDDVVDVDDLIEVIVNWGPCPQEQAP